MSAPIYTTGTELARAFVERADAHDTTIFLTMGAPDATHQLLPKSMKSERRKFTEVVTSFGPVLELIPDFHITILDIVEGQDKVWTYAMSTGTAVDGRKWENEIILMFDFVREADGGLKIARVREMLESAFSASFWSGSLPGTKSTE